MSADPTADPVERRAWEALGQVMDPELDEAITDLGFVHRWQWESGAVSVHLRLPTFFCAPNFAWLMVTDARDALMSVEGVDSVEVSLDDYFASDEINTGVAASVGFDSCFAGEVDGDLDELRATFRAKAYVAALERTCRDLRRRGVSLPALGEVRLGDLPAGPDTDRLTRRRGDLGLPAGPDDLLLVDASGAAIAVPELLGWLRRAQTVRVNMEGNGELCRGLLHTRYRLADLAGAGVSG